MESKSLGDMLRSSCTKWPERTAMMYPAKEGFQTLTYSQLFEKVKAYAGELQAAGLKRGDKICLQAESCVEWAFTDWACYCLGIILVPIYPTLTAEQSQYIAQDCGAKVVISSTEEQAEKMRGSPGVKVLLLKDSAESLSELVSQAKSRLSPAQLDFEIDIAQPDDMATIIYTSGTTGQPKGAMLSHRAFVHVCEAAKKSIPIDEKDIFLSFLPMSHVYERVAGQALPICIGASIAYAKSLMSLGRDMERVKPTIMLCVPRFLEATRDRIIDNAAKAPFIRKSLFNLAHSQLLKKSAGQFAPLAGPLSGIVGGTIRKRTGGRIRFFVSGGAALPPHVSAFYMGFGLTILQGYGLTETAAATCINHPDRNDPSTVGEPLEGVEVRIAYDGEILVRGPSRMIGYYNLPKDTQEAIDKDGWFHTGDIGKFSGKNLLITDRKKDLLILANGKNVAPQPIENKLRESLYIAEAVLFGDGNEYVYGLVVPDWDRLRSEFNTVEANATLVDDERVHKLIRAEVDRINKTLPDFEKVKKHAVLNASFTIEGGELTPSLKVKRKVVREKYQDVLQTLVRN